MRSAVIFGSSITSSRNNGATVFFRGLCQALARAGLQTIFAEESRRVAEGEDSLFGIAVRHYTAPADVFRIIVAAQPPRLIIKFAACGSMDDVLEEVTVSFRQERDRVIFVDGDAPVTLGEIRYSLNHPLRRTLPAFDGVLILAGGEVAAREFQDLGASRVRWGYCAVDEQFWRPVPPSPLFQCDFLFVANRLSDRDSRVREFFLGPAALCPDRRFLLAGSGWDNLDLPRNVEYIGHLSPQDLRRAYSSARLVLNVNREPMARYGYAPASRLFEAASCGACIVSDRWPGVEKVFTPGEEILLASGGTEVAAVLQGLSTSTRRQIGTAARRRVEKDYTCDRWVEWLFETLADWKLANIGGARIAKILGGA